MEQDEEKKKKKKTMVLSKVSEALGKLGDSSMPMGASDRKEYNAQRRKSMKISRY